MDIADGEPFDNSPKPFDLGIVRRDQHAHAEVLRAMRARAEQWGVAQGFEVVDAALVRTAEGVEVTIRLSSTTAEMCTVRTNALHAIQLQLTVEPKSWTAWIAARLGNRFETADRVFDEHWCIETDDELVAQRLIDARVRTALLTTPIWCRVSYANGQIELQLDSGEEKLTGRHLLAATEVAIALARATPEPPTTPYR